MQSFESVYGTPAAVVASAPGRVNLLGEHTDYNDGYVLPTAIPQTTVVALRPNGRDAYRVHAANLDRAATFALEHAPGEDYARYVHGCLAVAAADGLPLEPLDLHLQSTVPMGVGLSSSAALEVAVLRGLRECFRAPWDDLAIARLAQRVENEHVGVRCGIMDPIACSLARVDEMLFLDTRTLAHARLPLPAGSELLVVDSGIARTLASSAYNERRAECEAAARALGVNSLREVTDEAQVERLPAPLALRARHVVTENARVLEAARGVSAERFGRLMNASHGSLRDDYAVSVLALDQLGELLQNDSAVYGARLTGAGFGGACVALCQAGKAAKVGQRVVAAYNRSGAAARVLVPQLLPETDA